MRIEYGAGQTVAARLARPLVRTGRRLQAGLFRPVDGASLAVFRILFAFLLCFEVWRYFSHHWIEAKYVVPSFFFPYQGFEWVKPFAPQGMFWLFRFLGICAFLMMLGLYYRLAAWGVFFSFSYIFLIDKAQYLNHFYFTILLAFLMALAPANQVWSLDRLLGRVARHDHVPAWALMVMRAQMEIMLIWAGLVKLNADWLAGQPLADWLARAAWRFPDGMAGLMRDPDMAVAAAWTVAGLHLIGAPLLLVRRTRLFVFLLYAGFHLLNHLFWNIGIFPWLTIAGTLLFFGAGWPRGLAARLGIGRAALPVGQAVPAFAARPALTAFAILWVASQALLPLRPYLYAGNAAWNEQGHRFSWRMKLRDKEGHIRFVVRDPATGRHWPVRLRDHLTRRQIGALSTRPSLMLDFAHHLRDRWRTEHGVAKPQVFAESHVSVNGRLYRRYIDPGLDLAAIERTFLDPDTWVLPMEGADGESADDAALPTPPVWENDDDD